MGSKKGNCCLKSGHCSAELLESQEYNCIYYVADLCNNADMDINILKLRCANKKARTEANGPIKRWTGE